MISQVTLDFRRPVTLRWAYEHYRDGIQGGLTRDVALGLDEPVLLGQSLLPIVLAPYEGKRLAEQRTAVRGLDPRQSGQSPSP